MIRAATSLREIEYLKQRYTAILSFIGKILILSGIVMLTPLLLIVAQPSESLHAMSFIFPALLQILLGLLLQAKFPANPDITLSIQEGGIIVFISWLIVIAFSAWPFMSALGLSFSQAFFESMSGWTTTGLSVVDVTSAGNLILLWRSIIQLAGGAGLAIIMMSAIVGPTGVGVSSAEGRSDQLVPHVRHSARLVLVIYISYAIVGTVAYWWAGMSIFDAINHSFAAVSTGGFSTRPENIGYWDSAAVEAVSIPLMILGNLSFVTAWYLWRGKFGTVIKNGEVRLQIVVIPLFACAMFFLTCQALYPSLGKSIRVAIFETVSALTTTGFSTVSYSNWNGSGIFLMVLLMLIGGGTCSTAGGIKQFRIYLMWKQLRWDIQRFLLPRNAIQEYPIWEGNCRVYVDDARLRQTTVFVFLYLLTYVFGVMILCASGFNLSDSLFEFASALGTAGVSVGVTSAKMPGVALWAETIAMFLGRLEFFVVIVSMIKLSKDARLVFVSQKKPHTS